MRGRVFKVPGEQCDRVRVACTGGHARPGPGGTRVRSAPGGWSSADVHISQGGWSSADVHISGDRHARTQSMAERRRSHASARRTARCRRCPGPCACGKTRVRLRCASFSRALFSHPRKWRSSAMQMHDETPSMSNQNCAIEAARRMSPSPLCDARSCHRAWLTTRALPHFRHFEAKERGVGW